MKKRPILFSAPMVRALLDGSKTQTRRIVKPQPRAGFEWCRVNQVGPWFHIEADKPDTVMHTVTCPYGAAGDRLWVRETFREYDHVWTPDSMESAVQYRADFKCRANGKDVPEVIAPEKGWKPSIFMRPTQSRITLEIGSVRVERLNDISEADAKAEGVEPVANFPEQTDSYFPYTAEYGQLWDRINGDGSWALNPWVWVITFKRL